MPYPLNNCTDKNLDYFTSPIVFNRIKLKKKLFAHDLLNLQRKFNKCKKKILMKQKKLNIEIFVLPDGIQAIP